MNVTIPFWGTLNGIDKLRNIFVASDPSNNCRTYPMLFYYEWQGNYDWAGTGQPSPNANPIYTWSTDLNNTSMSSQTVLLGTHTTSPFTWVKME